MAKNDVTTNDAQQSRTQGRNETSGGQQKNALATRGAWDPAGFPLSPFSLLGLNPFSIMGRLMDQIDYVPRTESNSPTLQWAPAIEVAERDGNLVVRADLPGLKADDIRVEARDGALIIEGESRQEREEDRGGVHRSERRYGRFLRAIPLPENAKIDQASARLDSGVLEITVPVERQQSTNQRQIPVQNAASGSEQSTKTTSEKSA